MSSPHEVSRLLDDLSKGDRQALDALIPIVHDELHRIARGYLSRERPGHTLQATALVNEAYLRLVGEREMQWQNRAHFIGVAAQLMRFILVDHCRRKRFQKRGGDAERVTFDEGLPVAFERHEEAMALDEALAKLAEQDERKSRIAELRYFGGLSIEETAAVLALSEATIVREWRLTRAWLRKELS